MSIIKNHDLLCFISQVTLSQGTDHVAMFNDSTKIYDLKKDEDVCFGL